MPPGIVLDSVFRKTAGRCVYCGQPLARDVGRGGHGAGPPESLAWVVDHWIPEWALGRDAHELPNLWPACRRCCEEKGTWDGGEYVDTRRESWRTLHPNVDAFFDQVSDWLDEKQ